MFITNLSFEPKSALAYLYIFTSRQQEIKLVLRYKNVIHISKVPTNACA